jgi:hypothetical protein
MCVSGSAGPGCLGRLPYLRLTNLASVWGKVLCTLYMCMYVV